MSATPARIRVANRRNKRREQGLCIDCGAIPEREGQCCVKCQYKRNEVATHRKYKTKAMTNLSLPVLKDQPEGMQFTAFEPHMVLCENPPQLYYFCRHCEGWIPGAPIDRYQSDLGPLCGRQGHAMDCIRCGKEMHFIGVVS